MTKKDYKKFAEILNQELKLNKDNSDTILNIAEKMILIFAEDNPLFNPIKFKKAMLNAN